MSPSVITKSLRALVQGAGGVAIWGCGPINSGVPHEVLCLWLGQPAAMGRKKHGVWIYCSHTVDGTDPAPVDMVNIPLFTWCHACWVVQDFFHQQYTICIDMKVSIYIYISLHMQIDNNRTMNIVWCMHIVHVYIQYVRIHKFKHTR